MSGNVISSIEDLRLFLSESDDASTKEIVIDGSIRDDISKAYVAYGKLKVQKRNGFLGIGASVLTFLTGGLALIPAAIAFSVGSNHASSSIDEYQANKYADEVFILAYKRGYRLIKNNGNSLLLKR